MASDSFSRDYQKLKPTFVPQPPTWIAIISDIWLFLVLLCFYYHNILCLNWKVWMCTYFNKLFYFWSPFKIMQPFLIKCLFLLFYFIHHLLSQSPNKNLFYCLPIIQLSFPLKSINIIILFLLSALNNYKNGQS